MQKYNKETPIGEVKFERVSFWVQLHGIPPQYMTKEATLKISGVIGEVTIPKLKISRKLMEGISQILLLNQFFWLTPIEGILSFLTSSVTYIRLSGILLRN